MKEISDLTHPVRKTPESTGIIFFLSYAKNA